MPWCDPCDRYYAPSALNEDGTCPECGTNVGKATAADKMVSDAEAGTAEKAKIPWHFWLLLIVLAIYLGYRLFQGIAWVIRQF